VGSEKLAIVSGAALVLFIVVIKIISAVIDTPSVGKVSYPKPTPSAALGHGTRPDLIRAKPLVP